MLKEISIEIIRKCPNYCLHCSSSAHEHCEEVLPYNKFKEIILDAKKLGAKTICLSGGEPFLHNEIVEMISFVNSCDLECYVYTSGIIFDETNQRASLPKEILHKISNKVTKLIFNLEAGTEKTYNQIMGTQDCFEKMQQSIILANETKICIEAHFVPMSMNIDEIPAVISLCKKLNISKLSFLRLVLHGRALQNSNEISLTPEKTVKLKEYLNKLQNNSDVNIRIGVPLSLDTTCHKCEAANGKINIKYDGVVFPCEVFKNYSLKKSFGTLLPESIYDYSLFDIYNKSEYLHHIRKLSKDFSEANKCETCIGQHLIDIEKREEL